MSKKLSFVKIFKFLEFRMTLQEKIINNNIYKNSTGNLSWQHNFDSHNSHFILLRIVSYAVKIKVFAADKSIEIREVPS